MSDTVIDHGTTSYSVAAAQALLNRGGAMIAEDGQFGPGTARAVREFQAQAALPVTGVIDADTLAALRAVPDPCPDVASAAVAFIVAQEVGDGNQYDRTYCRPSYPGESSGITIGVGYDLKEEAGFEADWGGLLTNVQMAALRPYVGRPGTEAAMAVLGNIVVPRSQAWQVFTRSSIPANLADCRGAFADFDALAPLCRGALLSLVFNRGAGMGEGPPRQDSRKEMRQIRDAMAARDFASIPGYLRAMERLWPNTKDLRDRRDLEAAMFQKGLQQPQ